MGVGGEQLPREGEVVVADLVSHVQQDGIHSGEVKGATAPNVPNINHQVPVDFLGSNRRVA